MGPLYHQQVTNYLSGKVLLSNFCIAFHGNYNIIFHPISALGETHVSRESDDPLPSAATREDRHKHHKRRDSKKEHVSAYMTVYKIIIGLGSIAILECFFHAAL